ncbi:hypothetical protein ACGFX4_23405 [Kitasatospora sp. NPDC048365]|uniref:hypothetical protein n=1 Tax=Kitasatospora sp. NPDC048365 TaxID=3364050 RepID=UPI00371CEB64
MGTPVITQKQGAVAGLPAQAGRQPVPRGPRGALGRLRSQAQTPPGRLRLAGGVLAALVLLFGTVAAWQVADRAAMASQVVSHSQPLSQDAAEIYRSLADADTTAAGGFLLAGAEPPEIRKRYQDDLATAARLLAQAAARTGSSPEAQRSVAELNQQLPRYAGLVETARANDRQGLPLGGAYLRYASKLMQQTMLPNAQKLVDAEAKQLDRDQETASAYPLVALLLGLLALGALARYQVVLFRRTNRVFNVGLVGASAAVLVAVVWLAAGSAAAGSALADSRQTGSRPLAELNRVRISALQAHAAENLNLVDRGSSDTYSKAWKTLADPLNGPSRQPGSVAWASEVAPSGANAAMTEGGKQFAAWQKRHQAAADQQASGDYDAALRATLSATGGDTSDAAFNAMDEQFGKAAAIEQGRFEAAASGVGGSLELLAVGAAVLAVGAAIGVVRGVGRRLAEYR